jgi:hypothetical protein
MKALAAILGLGLLLGGSMWAEETPRDDKDTAAQPSAGKAAPVPRGGTAPARANAPAPKPPAPNPMIGPLNRSAAFPPPDLPPQAFGRPPRPQWRGGPLPPFLFALADKPTAEQEQLLRASPRFRQMSPLEQQEIRERLRKISAMNPRQRKELRDRFEVFHHLSPAARDKIRADIFPAWNRLAPPRRDVMMREYRLLARMRPAERNQRFLQDTFVKQFSDDEQRLLRDLLSVTTP